jgi:hypothetical protein
MSAYAVAAVVYASAYSQEPTRIDVQVLADGENCSIYQRQIRCEAIGEYLRDERHVPANQYITIIVEGTKNSQARGRHVRELIAKAGYSKIVLVGFITEPDHGTGTRP